MIETVFAIAALAVALWLRPWRQKGLRSLATPMLATIVLLPWLWALPAMHRSPLSLPWSGACLVLLMLGWPLAVPVLCAVGAGALVIGGLDFQTAVTATAWLGIIPATLALGLGALVRRVAGTHPFVYILGRSFLGSVLCLFAAGLLRQWAGPELPGVDRGLSTIAVWLTAWGDGFVTGMLCAIFVAYRPQWLATWSDTLYLRRGTFLDMGKSLPMSHPQTFAPGLTVRGFIPPLNLKDFRLIAFDMDSTLINIECVDEIADVVDRKAEVAAITEAAMRGEIADYKASLRQRVALLRGVTVADLEQVYTERLRLNPGAAELVAACKKAGLKVLLVSGGFTFFTDRVRDQLGIDFTRSNMLEIESGPNCGQLTGRMVDQAWGDICDGAEKRKMLLETCAALGISPKQAIAMGDGANDLPMMGEAGLSVAYHAKPAVREQAMVAINEGGLNRLLEIVRP
jgi:phosphoserine phosphatase